MQINCDLFTILGGLGDGWGRFLTNHREEAVPLFWSEAVAAREVVGGVAVEKHLMEFNGETAQTVHAVVEAHLEAVEGITVAEVPVGSLCDRARDEAD